MAYTIENDFGIVMRIDVYEEAVDVFQRLCEITKDDSRKDVSKRLTLFEKRALFYNNENGEIVKSGG